MLLYMHISFDYQSILPNYLYKMYDAVKIAIKKDDINDLLCLRSIDSLYMDPIIHSLCVKCDAVGILNHLIVHNKIELELFLDLALKYQQTKILEKILPLIDPHILSHRLPYLVFTTNLIWLKCS